MSQITILHNPRCSKSRQTLELIKENGIAPEVIEYLKTPLDLQQLEQLMAQLGLDDPKGMMRIKEPEFQQLNLSDDNVTKQQLLEAIVSVPKLLERPVVINGNQARIGRPPEAVLEIL